MREAIARIIHSVWCRWIDQLLKNAQLNSDGTVLLSSQYVQSLLLFKNTRYSDLSEQDQRSERDIADEIFRQVLNSTVILTEVTQLEHEETI